VPVKCEGCSRIKGFILEGARGRVEHGNCNGEDSSQERDAVTWGVIRSRRWRAGSNIEKTFSMKDLGEFECLSFNL
jgi:hypothetical protein